MVLSRQIKCRLSLVRTISSVRLRPLTTFNRPETTVGLRSSFDAAQESGNARIYDTSDGKDAQLGISTMHHILHSMAGITSPNSHSHVTLALLPPDVTSTNKSFVSEPNPFGVTHIGALANPLFLSLQPNSSSTTIDPRKFLLPLNG
jgi:hypothetical protein